MVVGVHAHVVSGAPTTGSRLRETSSARRRPVPCDAAIAASTSGCTRPPDRIPSPSRIRATQLREASVADTGRRAQKRALSVSRTFRCVATLERKRRAPARLLPRARDPRGEHKPISYQPQVHDRVCSVRLDTHRLRRRHCQGYSARRGSAECPSSGVTMGHSTLVWCRRPCRRQEDGCRRRGERCGCSSAVLFGASAGPHARPSPRSPDRVELVSHDVGGEGRDLELASAAIKRHFTSRALAAA